MEHSYTRDWQQTPKTDIQATRTILMVSFVSVLFGIALHMTMQFHHIVCLQCLTLLAIVTPFVL